MTNISIVDDVLPDDEYLELMSLEECMRCLGEFAHMIRNAEENKQFSLKHAKFALEKIQEKILISQDLIDEGDATLQEARFLIDEEYELDVEEHLKKYEVLCDLVDDFARTVKSFAGSVIPETDYRAGLAWTVQQESCNAGV